MNTVVAGTKISGYYSRALPAFESPIEFGVEVPYDDYRFLRAYEAHNFAGPQSQDISVITTVNDLGDRVPDIVINDFDGNRIKNTVIGPSSSSDNSSKGVIAFEQGKKKTAVDNQIELTYPVSADYLERDNVLISREPLFMAAEDGVDSTVRGLVRKPKMAGVVGHTNSFISYGAGGDLHISVDITDKGSIDPDMVYRFSFYYRAKCVNSITIVLMMYFYTNEGLLISSYTSPSASLSKITSEAGDFSYFAASIPNVIDSQIIPTNAKRIGFLLDISTSGVDPLTFELIYPVLEHTFNVSRTTGYVFIPYAPSSVGIAETESGKLDISHFGTTIPYDTTKLFKGHIGKGLFKIQLGWNLIEETYVNQMRILEQMNSMGYSIVLRPKHPDLPPVMIGDIKVESRNPNYDFNDNELSIEFEETV